MKKIFCFIMICLIASSNIQQVSQKAEPIFDTTSYAQLNKEQRKQIDCLAYNIYHEAAVERETGRIAVALVTLNRVDSNKFPKSVCKVVYQKSNDVCQFSWRCLDILPKVDKLEFDNVRNLATFVYLNYRKIEDITQGALFYHADYVNPRWKNLEMTTKIGRHVFYRVNGES